MPILTIERVLSAKESMSDTKRVAVVALKKIGIIQW
jgi:hypothetical protein